MGQLGVPVASKDEKEQPVSGYKQGRYKPRMGNFQLSRCWGTSPITPRHWLARLAGMKGEWKTTDPHHRFPNPGRSTWLKGSQTHICSTVLSSCYCRTLKVCVYKLLKMPAGQCIFCDQRFFLFKEQSRKMLACDPPIWNVQIDSISCIPASWCGLALVCNRHWWFAKEI